MKKYAIVAFAATVLAGCGGQDIEETSSSSLSNAPSSSSSLSSVASSTVASSTIASSSSLPLSSSSSVFSSSSSSLPSSSPVPSSSSVSVSSSSSGNSGGDVSLGKMIMDGPTCNMCHNDTGAPGAGSAGDGVYTGLADIYVDAFTYQDNSNYASGSYTGNSQADLARFIEDEMCGNNPGCGEDAAAYLWSLRGQNVVIEDLSCDAEAPIHYGRRTLKLLTSYEYDNSLQALFGAPLPEDFSTEARAAADVKIAFLPNHNYEPISEGRLNTYELNAIDLSRWARQTTGALPFSCTEAAACAQDFIDQFAYFAYRRPLTAQEKTQFTDIITGANRLDTGLDWAIRTVLMSPNFLYRSELGRTVAEALAAEPDPNAEPQYVAAADPVVVEANSSDIGLHNRFAVEANTSNYIFTGNDLVTVTVAGKSEDKSYYDPEAMGTVQATVWPNMRLEIGNQEIGQTVVRSSSGRTYSFRVEGKTGGQYVAVINSPVEGQAASGGTLNVVKVGFAPAKIKEGPAENEAKLQMADPSAYVLDAYELASVLSYMYTGSSPDAELLYAADQGDLFRDDLRSAQIDRLMDSALGRKHIGRFAGLWLRTDPVISANRSGNDDFTPDVKASMAQEIREIVKHAFYDETVPLSAIYSGDYTMLDSVLAQYYGIAGGGTAPMQFEKVDTTGTARGGVIASGAYMALNAHMFETSPIKRAVHVRQDMLCQNIPLPNSLEDADESLREEFFQLALAKEADGNLTTTEFYELQTNAPGSACVACHNAIINPLFAMDDFDHVGLLRKRVGGEVVQKGRGDTGMEDVAIDMVNNGGFLYSPSVLGVLSQGKADADKESGNGLSFSGGKDLGAKMVEADLRNLHLCAIEKSARMLMGHPLTRYLAEPKNELALNTAEESQFICVRDEMEKAYQQNNGSLRAAFKALGMSDLVMFRR